MINHKKIFFAVVMCLMVGSKLFGAASSDAQQQACPICREVMNVTKTTPSIIHTPCNHHFHKTCLYDWLARVPSCPLCRTPLDLLNLEEKLITAIYRNNAPEVERLITIGADVNCEEYGKTALMLAASMNKIEIVKVLITAKANLHTLDHAAKTALIIAAEKGHTEIVELLIEAGADTNLRELEKTVFTMATNAGHPEIVDLLKKAKRKKDGCIVS